MAVLLENLPSDYGDTDTEDDTDDEAPGPRDLINNDPLSRAQEECCTIIIGGDETAPDADVGNPDMDGRPSTSEDDPTSQVNNKNRERRRWRKKLQSMEEREFRPEQIGANSATNPTDAFFIFFYAELVDRLVFETNLYCTQKGKVGNISINEMYVFFWS